MEQAEKPVYNSEGKLLRSLLKKSSIAQITRVDLPDRTLEITKECSVYVYHLVRE
ncbi:hypothetical protein H6F71_18045 [Microcoleus sp. FACHB-61]|nr:hypothetical protein [Microcoleus sp. FACHB-61]